MQDYHLHYDAFCNGAGDTFRLWRDMTREAMCGLIDRYDLAGKRILSLGAGIGFEESWFVDAGCDVTLLDNSIDLERHLKTIKTANGERSLRFLIGDVGELKDAHALGTFNVVYASGLSPDEYRRAAIHERAAPSASLRNRLALRIKAIPTWPAREAPYHQLVCDVLATRLAEGGLFITQHYRGGVLFNRSYLSAAASQFRALGLEIIEAYRFRKSMTHLLMVVLKGSPGAARELSDQLAARKPITTFHGRYDYPEIKNDVVRVA